MVNVVERSLLTASDAVSVLELSGGRRGPEVRGELLSTGGVLFVVSKVEDVDGLSSWVMTIEGAGWA